MLEQDFGYGGVMKRITPRREYDGEAGYPAASEDRLSRRAFFGRAGALAAAAAAAVTGVSVAGKRGEAARAQRGAGPASTGAAPTSIRLDLPYQQVIPGTDLRPERVEIFVSDKAIARFLQKYDERGGLQEAVTKVTAKAKAEDFYEGARLYQLEQRIARSLESRIRKRTGQRVPALDVMLHAGHGMHIRTAGVMIRPSRPIYPPHRSP
jgi:hypothetical protein